MLTDKVCRARDGVWDVWTWSPVLRMYLRKGHAFASRDAARKAKESIL